MSSKGSGGSGEDLVAAAPQLLEFLFQGVDRSLCLDERLGECATAPTLADEVDEVREPTLLGVQLSLLEPQYFWDVRIELPDLLLAARRT